ncbi:MAG: MMPL family transporter [Planctomycetota bacterium]
MKRRLPLSLVTLLATFPPILVGLILCMGTFRNDIPGWLAAGSTEQRAHQQFIEEFDVGEVAIITWQGCRLEDPRLVLLAQELTSRDFASQVKSVISGQTLVETLVTRGRLSHRAAKARLRGSLISTDGEETFIGVNLTEQATKDRPQFFKDLYRASESAGIPSEQLFVGGVAHDVFSLDYQGLWSPLRAVPFISLCSFLWVWFFVRKLDLALFVSGLGCYVGMLSMPLVYLSGWDLNAVVWTLPTLTMLLTMSSSLHFLGYYRFALESNPAPDAVVVASKLARRPTILCSMTTAAGLFSLLISETPPVRQFGGFGGTVVLISTALVLWSLPDWLRVRPLSRETVLTSPLFSRQQCEWGARLANRFRVPIVAAFSMLIVLMAFQIPSLRTSVNVRNLFPADSPVITDAEWIESEVVHLSSVELLLTFKNGADHDDLARIKLVGALHRALMEKDEITGVMSPLTFLPSLRNPRRGVMGVVDRQANQAKLTSWRESLDETGFHRANDTQMETWRVSMRVSNLDEINKEKLNRFVHETVEEVCQRDGADWLQDDDLSWATTGSPLIFDSVERQFLTDLRVTYATAIVVIFVIVLVVLRSLSGSILLSIPNVFPAVVVLGATAATGMALDVASLMTASVALGIGVDDTLHYSLWWKKRIGDGLPCSEAVTESMNHCGMAMLQTSVVTGTSVLLYAFCGFLPTVRFGLLLSAMLFSALVADLVLLPALLSLPMTRRFVAGR